MDRTQKGCAHLLPEAQAGRELGGASLQQGLVALIRRTGACLEQESVQLQRRELELLKSAHGAHQIQLDVGRLSIACWALHPWTSEGQAVGVAIRALKRLKHTHAQVAIARKACVLAAWVCVCVLVPCEAPSEAHMALTMLQASLGAAMRLCTQRARRVKVPCDVGAQILLV